MKTAKDFMSTVKHRMRNKKKTPIGDENSIFNAFIKDETFL